MKWALTDFEKISAAHGMCEDERQGAQKRLERKIGAKIGEGILTKASSLLPSQKRRQGFVP